MLVGKRIKIARIETDVSQEALAHALDVSQKTVSAWESGEIEQAEFIQSRDRLRAELANIPDAPPPITVEYDYATIRAMLDNLSLTLQMSSAVDTAAANRALLALFDAVEFDGKSIVRVVWRAPFESFNQS